MSEKLTFGDDLERLYDIASILIRYGFGDMLQRFGMGDAIEHLGKMLSWERDDELFQLAPPQRLRRALEDMGPAFIKLGQILATRMDLFPPEWIDELQKLQSHVPPVDFEELRPQLEDDLGAPPEDVFAAFETEPIGAASIAQVHRARLHSGPEVIVKIRRPGIRPVIEADLRILTQLAEFAEQRIPRLRLYRPKAMLQQFAASVLDELDLAVECQNAERVAGNFAHHPILVVPKVYRLWAKERLNVQEYIQGVSGRDIEKIDAAHLDRKALARHGADALLKMILIDGFFHADPHPGNLFYLSGSRIALIDYGMMGRLPEARRNQVADLLRGFVQHHTGSVVKTLLEWSENDEADRDHLHREIEGFISRHSGLSLEHLNVSDMLMDLTALLRGNGLTLPPDLALMIKVLVTLEGLGRQLDPDFKIAEAMRPVLSQALLQRYAADVLGRYGWLARPSIADLLTRLPQELPPWLSGERIEASPSSREAIAELKRIGGRVDRAADRLTMALLSAALIGGTSILSASGRGLVIFGVPVFDVLACAAIASGTWILVSLWRNKSR